MIIIRKPLLDNASQSVDSTSTPVNAPLSTASSTNTYSPRGVTSIPTSNSSLVPRSTDSNQALGIGVVVAIVISIVVCLLVALAIVIYAFRLRRKSSPRPSFNKIIPRRLGQLKSESSESLTSFDTSTDRGQRRAAARLQFKSPAVNLERVDEDVEKHADTSNLTVPRIPALNISTVSLPNYNTPLGRLSIPQSVSHGRGSSDPTSLYSQPKKLILSDTALSKGRARPHTHSALPPLRTSISAPFSSQERSASDTASPYRTHLLSPIPDSPVKITKVTHSVQLSMSSSLTPAKDSPHSLASLHLDTFTITSPSSRKNKKGRSVATASPITSPLSFKNRMKHGMSPISVKSRTSVGTYLESKPLPPSPPGPPAPPPPFPIPTAPLILAPKRSIPLRSAKSETAVSRRTHMATVSESSAQPFNELLHPAHYYQRSISETSLRKYKQSAHISSLVKPSSDTLREQSLKPILKLDTSGPAKKPQPLPVALVNTPLPNTAVTATPISTLRSAPPNMQQQQQQAIPMIQTPISAAALSAINPPSLRSESPRPISTAATTASSRPPLTPAGPFELCNDKDEKRDSLEPLPLALPSRVQSQALSISTTIRSEKLTTPTSASFLSIDPFEADSRHNSLIINRSPSISVPIVFKFRMSKSKKNSMRRSAARYV